MFGSVRFSVRMPMLSGSWQNFMRPKPPIYRWRTTIAETLKTGIQAVMQTAGKERFSSVRSESSPYVDIGKNIRLHSGSMWSNQVSSRIAWLNPDFDRASQERIDILYPHWGYELEKYPRPEIVEMAMAYGSKIPSDHRPSSACCSAHNLGAHWWETSPYRFQPGRLLFQDPQRCISLWHDSENRDRAIRRMPLCHWQHRLAIH